MRRPALVEQVNALMPQVSDLVKRLAEAGLHHEGPKPVGRQLVHVGSLADRRPQAYCFQTPAAPGVPVPPSVDGNSFDRLNAALAGRYRVERVLGHGGMATVYLADDLRHDRRVAVKIIHSELANALVAERFLREIRIEAQLTHPNIITLLDSGVIEAPPDPPRAFYVMPYVEGESLRERMRREGSLPVEEAVQITREVAAALDYAHHQGVIHRDIKPENILLVAGRPVVADFGVARLRGATGLSGLSSGALALGTPYYMSPEQWSSDPRLDGRSDIYSLGCVLYEMLAGEPPFTGATIEAIRARHAAEPPRPLRTIRPSVPDQVMGVIERAMAKVPADRFATAGELAAALAGELQVRRPRRRRRGILFGALAAGALGVAVVLWRFSRPDPSVDPNRFAVLPFREVARTRSPLTGQAAALAVHEALAGRWRDLDVVHPLQVDDALAQKGQPTSRDDALAVARALGAGRLVWGEISASGDTTWVGATLYDVSRRGVELGNTRERLVAGEAGGVFGRLVDSLIGQLQPGAAGSMGGTRSLAAHQALAEAIDAVTAWDVATAEVRLLLALKHDPDYPQANLQLGQLRQWLERPPRQWRPLVVAALRGAPRLSPADSGLAAALLELADGNYSQACDRFRELIRRDSLDFNPWLGLGDCQRLDSVVVRDPRSPSRWRFRSSYHDAAEAYSTVLTLVPSGHLAYQAFSGLERMLLTAPNTVREGRVEGAETPGLAAFPSLEGDTLAFVPWPRREVLDAVPHAVPASRHDAVARNRRLLREIASRWVKAFPRSVPALRAFAHAVESQADIGDHLPDGPSALSAVRSMRALSGDTGLAFAVWEVRLRVKRGEFVAARLLADSLLQTAEEPAAAPSPEVACLAALTGRVHRAANLLARSVSEDLELHLLGVPPPLAADAKRLLAYAAFSGPAESLRVIERRVLDQIEGYAAAAERVGWRQVLLEHPAQLAFPVLLGPDSGNYILRIEAALRKADTAVVRGHFESLHQFRSRMPLFSLSIDAAFLEARLHLAIGDSAGAADILDRTLGALPSLGMALLDQVEQAAALGRAMALRARLAEAAGNRPLADRWRRAVADLWAGADPELRSELRDGT